MRPSLTNPGLAAAIGVSAALAAIGQGSSARGQEPAAPLAVEGAPEPGAGADDTPVGPTAQRVALTFDAPVAVGLGDDRGLVLFFPGIGADLRATGALTLRARLLAHVAFGESELGEAAAGVGGELALRVALCTACGDVRPYLEAGAGLVLFGTEFLPGGARYVLRQRVGVGLAFRLTPSLTLAWDVAALHQSNGQGPGDHNPAFDGVHVGLGLAVGLGDAEVLPRTGPELARGHGRRGPALVADGTVGSVDGELYGSGRLRAIQPLGSELVSLATDLEAGRLAGFGFYELGGAVVVRPGETLFAAHGGYRRFAGVDVGVAALQAAWNTSDEVTLLAQGHLEDGGFGRTTWLAAAVRAYPIATLRLELGLRLEGVGEENDLEPVVGFAWQLPIPAPGWQLSLFAEHPVGFYQAGVRVAFGAGSDLRARDRSRGWRRLR